MEKKVYIRPLMTVVKIKAYRILQGSPTDDVRRYEEKSENESY